MTTPESAVPSPADLLAMIPYAATLGMTLDEATPELVRGSLRWSPGLCTTGGQLSAHESTGKPVITSLPVHSRSLGVLMAA
jgi:hypothetical protein